MGTSTIFTWILIAGAIAVSAFAVVLVRRVRAEVESRYRRTEAWLAILGVLRPRAPFGPTGPWIASPELLHDLVLIIFETRPQRVLELGSGMSTLVCAYALEAVGQGGKIISLDHDDRFAETTRRQLRMHGLDGIATVLHAPLRTTTTDVGAQSWYGVPDEALRGPIDLLIVDGPPGGGERLARYPALPVLRSHLAVGAVIVVDDARRPGEQEIVERWHRAHPDFTVQHRASEKGTAILRHVTTADEPAR